jgi:hypothetical protein
MTLATRNGEPCKRNVEALLLVTNAVTVTTGRKRWNSRASAGSFKSGARRALSAWSHRKCKMFPFSHSEGWFDWDSNPIHCSATSIITQKNKSENIMTFARKQHVYNVWNVINFIAEDFFFHKWQYTSFTSYKYRTRFVGSTAHRSIYPIQDKIQGPKYFISFFYILNVV